MALLHRRPLAHAHDKSRQFRHQRHIPEQPGHDVTGVHRDERDLRVSLGKLLGVEQLRELALPVTLPSAGDHHAAEVFLLGSQRVEVDALFGSLFVCDRSHVDDAHVRAGELSGLLEEGQQELDEEGVAHLVGGPLDLVAVGGCGGVDGHDACVEHENVESIRGRFQLVCAGLHGRQ